MNIRLAKRNRGIATVGAVIIICLLIVFVLGFFMLMVRALKRLDTHNVGGGQETNDLTYTGPGVVVWQQTNIVEVPTNVTAAEEILYTDNLNSPWQPLTNFVLLPDQVFDWTTLIDKTKPCGFFKITIYGTNQ